MCDFSFCYILFWHAQIHWNGPCVRKVRVTEQHLCFHKSYKWKIQEKFRIWTLGMLNII